jgi:SAM-dependent methyltransferase
MLPPFPQDYGSRTRGAIASAAGKVGAVLMPSVRVAAGRTDRAASRVGERTQNSPLLALADLERGQDGDATNLHGLQDRMFDVVLSVFGAMFAPKPLDMAGEMVRVTRPGGRIVMGN